MQHAEYERMFRAEDSYWWFVARRRLALRLLEAEMGRLDGRRILDLGCGTGAGLSELTELGAEATGADFSAEALQFCRSRGLPRLVLARGEAAPFRSASFDAAIALDLYEHIEHVEEALAETRRLLKPGGVLVLSVPAYRWLWGPHDVALMHHRRYTRGLVRQALLDAGLEPITISHSVFFLFPAVVAVRVLDRFRRGPAKVSLPAVAPWANRTLTSIMAWETPLIRRGFLPWGSSVVAVARRLA